MIDDLDLRLRKRLGIFYTPRGVANAICNWAIRSTSDVILDPSYGGCVFFAAAIDRLRGLDSTDAARNLYGADLDPKAKRFLSLLGGQRRALSSHFYESDFMTLRTTDFPTLFDSVIGNPPYVRHHKMTQKTMMAARRATSWCELPETSSYWAYFTLHATKFLRKGGRLGMVLPGAFLAADYAEGVWTHLLASFLSVRVILVRASVFGDAEERCVILLADGYGGSCGSPTYLVVDTFEALGAACTPTPTLLRARHKARPAGAWPLPLLSIAQRELFGELQGRPEVRNLGALAKIRIGVVTGANDFFVLSPERVRELGLSHAPLLPIFSSSRQLRTLAVDNRDLAALADAQIAALLLNAGRRTRSKAVERYVQSSRAVRVKNRFKCRSRDPWFVLTDTKIPDAFLTYVNHFSPRLTLNFANATCTNAIHRLWWTESLSEERRRLLSLASLSSLFGLSAELCGRSVGGGALKIEIGDAAKLLVVAPSKLPDGVAEACNKANIALDDFDWELARITADDFVLGKVLRLPATKIGLLRAAHDRLMQIRLETAGATPRRPSRNPPRRRTARARHRQGP
jgi:adenine-specific DNA-methyltransferase